MSIAASPLAMAAKQGIQMMPGMISGGAGLGGMASALTKASAPSAASVFGMVDKTGLGKPQSWLEGLLGRLDKGKMRDAGLGLMQMGMQQQPQSSPMQLTPFSPGGGGGGGGSSSTPQLLALAQQLGLNKVL